MLIHVFLLEYGTKKAEIIAINVDDLIIVIESNEEIHQLKHSLPTTFKMKDHMHTPGIITQ